VNFEGVKEDKPREQAQSQAEGQTSKATRKSVIPSARKKKCPDRASFRGAM